MFLPAGVSGSTGQTGATGQTGPTGGPRLWSSLCVESIDSHLLLFCTDVWTHEAQVSVCICLQGRAVPQDRQEQLVRQVSQV